MKRALILVAIIFALAACTVGVTGPKQALIPEGEPASVALASGGAAVEGELLPSPTRNSSSKSRAGSWPSVSPRCEASS